MPSFGLHTDQIAIARTPENSFITFAIRPISNPALPPGHRHRRRALFITLGVVYPECLACRGIDCHTLRQRRIEIKNPIDHQWRRLEVSPVGGVLLAIQIGGFLHKLIHHYIAMCIPFSTCGGGLADKAIGRNPTPGNLEL